MAESSTNEPSGLQKAYSFYRVFLHVLAGIGLITTMSAYLAGLSLTTLLIVGLPTITLLAIAVFGRVYWSNVQPLNSIGAWRQDYQPKAIPSTSPSVINPPEPFKPIRRFGIHWDSEYNPLCPVDDTFLAMTESGKSPATGKYFEVFHCPKCKTDYRLRDDGGNPIRIGFAKKRVRLNV
ncbi:MAG TPA: hypothetical protein VJR02_05585 [Pyrinomonadaceae bacterium]|nr:hypothetical protein [Pyrinomonadaceae bacterium]